MAIAGVVWLVRSRNAARWRAIPLGFLVIVGAVLLTGGKSYYVVGMYPALLAAGAIVVDGWLDRGRRRLRAASFTTAVALSGTIVAVLVLPVLAAATLATTPLPEIYKESAEQIGWPALVSTVRGVVDRLPSGQRADAVIMTSNYGEAGALQLLGSGLPPVYSGHNSYWYWGPPPPGLLPRW